MAGVGIALRDQAYEIADIPLLDLMNALGAPVGNNVAPQETGYSSTSPDLRNVFANERLDQIIHAVDDHAAAGLFFLFCPIATIEPSRKDLLRLGLGHRQGDASIRPDGIFAQPGAGARKPIHHQKHLAAFRRHFHAEARQTGVPVNRIFFEDGKIVDRRLGQANTRNRLLPLSATSTSNR
jgi:hypothetical protein